MFLLLILFQTDNFSLISYVSSYVFVKVSLIKIFIGFFLRYFFCNTLYSHLLKKLLPMEQQSYPRIKFYFFPFLTRLCWTKYESVLIIFLKSKLSWRGLQVLANSSQGEIILVFAAGFCLVVKLIENVHRIKIKWFEVK